MSIQAKDVLGILKNFPVPAVCCFVSLACAVSFYFRSDLRAETIATLEERTKELTRLKANITASKQLDEQLESLVKANAQFQQSALRVTELAKNPQVFYDLEKDTGVNLVEVRQLVTTSPGKLATTEFMIIPFEITANGDFKQVIEFLKRLEFGPNVCRINTASLVPVQGTRLTLAVNIDVLGLR